MRDIIKYVWLGVILFSGFTSSAQLVDLKLVNEEDLSMFYSEIRKSKGNTLNYADIKGSPYYYDDFELAEIYFKSGKLITDVSIRLNLYKKTLEFQRDSEILEMTNIEDLDKVKIKDDYFIFVNGVDSSGDGEFYKVEVDGIYQLLQLFQVAFFDATKAKSFYEDDIPAEFKLVDGKYFLRFENNGPIAFGNKKDLPDSFAKSHTSLVEYAKKNKLNAKKYDDLIKMVNYLNASNEKPAN